jgi:hypothetical protein
MLLVIKSRSKYIFLGIYKNIFSWIFLITQIVPLIYYNFEYKEPIKYIFLEL